MERIRVSINDVFGYASLDLNWIEEHDFNYELFAAENGWICELGSLAVTFRLDINAPIVAFGSNPGRKMLRQMAKDQKKRVEILKSTKFHEE